MDLLKKKEKKEALEKLERSQRYNEVLISRASSAVEDLYKERKKALEASEDAEDVLKRQPDFSIEYTKRIANARASIRLFTEAMLNEKMMSGTIDDPTGKYARAALAGTATGAAVAALGPSAAMAFATTFGTAATGTAISALSGAAATNAALAWLGGGAIVAGGGGVAAGSAILALFGPVGLAIGGVAAGVAGFGIRNKNGKIADDANKKADEIIGINGKLESAISEIESLSSDIAKITGNLKDIMKKNTLNHYYGDIVNYIVELCTLINKEINIK